VREVTSMRFSTRFQLFRISRTYQSC
jgi:hypothetical protein